MKFLYIPGRKRYKKQSVFDNCPFCSKFPEDKDRENLIIKRFNTCALFMCLHPYNAGHLLVIPYKHTGNFTELGKEEQYEMIDVMNLAIISLGKALDCQNMNIGMNFGDGTAGGSVPGHIHLHIVPRFKGDTNFLPIITSTRLITRDLMEVYDILVEEFK